jgi:alpha-L-fucosidase 2
VPSRQSARRRLAPHDLIFTQAPDEWTVGAPLGNGHVGAMLWGTGSPLCLTLDRDDIWDLRADEISDPEFNWQTIRPLALDRNADALSTIIERNLGLGRREGRIPIKLPLGRLELVFGEETGLTGRLHLGDATFRGDIGSVKIEACVAAESPVVLVRASNCTTNPDVSFHDLTDLNPEEADGLALTPSQQSSEGGESWVVQEFPGGGQAAVAWCTLRRGSTVTLAVSVTTHNDGPDPVSLARLRVRESVRQAASIIKTHTDWWESFWSKSSIHLPDGEFETLWYYGLYKLASSSRAGHLPANLQGLWVTDGVVPPWHGEYAANMNVQEAYWPVYGSNHLDLGLPLYDWLMRIADKAIERTREIFGFDGLHLMAAMAADGSGVPGWGTVQFWPGTAAWLGHHFWLHWRYSGDTEFLRTHAYPYLKMCADFWEGFLEPDEKGILHVPLSYNPEWDGDLPSAWGRDTTIDLSLVRNLFEWCIDAATVLDLAPEARNRWQDVLERLAPYVREKSGGLTLMEGIASGEPVSYSLSHRHMSHLMPIFPMSDINVEGSDEDRQTIADSLHRVEYNGYGEWTGWSFPYTSLIASRAARPEMAAYMLRLYMDAFVMPNGMHVNGDWRERGISHYHYRPPTMEAECAASSAVNEMLLQSWGGRIRLFPAIPASWRDCSFENLLAEGAVTVSANHAGGRTVYAEFVSKYDTEIVVAGFDETSTWPIVNDARWESGLWRVRLTAGTPVIATAEEPTDSRTYRRPRVENPFGFHGWDA